MSYYISALNLRDVKTFNYNDTYNFTTSSEFIIRLYEDGQLQEQRLFKQVTAVYPGQIPPTDKYKEYYFRVYDPNHNVIDPSNVTFNILGTYKVVAGLVHWSGINNGEDEYEREEYTYSIEIKKKLDRITYNSSPSTFVYGDKFSRQTYTAFAYFDDGTSITIKNDITVNGMPKVMSTITKAISYTVSYTYDGITKSVTCEPKVYLPYVKDDVGAITWIPYKATYVSGTKYSIDSDVLSVTLKDSKSSNCRITLKNFTDYFTITKEPDTEITEEENFDVTLTWLEDFTQTKTFRVHYLNPSLTISNLKTTFRVGERFGLGAGTIIASYKDEGVASTKDVASDCGFSLDSTSTLTIGDNITNDMVGDHTISIIYYDSSLARWSYASYNITVTTVSSELTISGNKVHQLYENEFTYGDDFSVTLTYSDGSTEDITDSVTLTNSKGYEEGSTIDSKDDFYVTVAYQTGSEADGTYQYADFTYDVRVYSVDEEDDIERIEIDGNQTSQFNYGDYFSTGDAKVNVIFKNSAGTKAINVTDCDSISPTIGSLLERKTALNVVITYGSFTCSYTANIKYLYALTLDTDDVTTTFYQGSNFNADNLSATATYKITDGTTEEEDVTDDVSIKIGNDSYVNNIKLSTAGEKTVTVSYTDALTETATYQISVVALEVQKLEITKNNIDVTVAGQGLFYQNQTTLSKITDTDVLEVTATYNDGTTSVIEATNYTISPAVGSTFRTTGTHEVTISYGGKSVTYEVLVEADSVSSLSVSGNVITAKVGDTFSLSGMIVTATYASGNVGTIGYGTGGYAISVAPNYTFTKDDLGEKEVTISYGGVTTTYTITVSMPAVSRLQLNSSSIGTTFKNGDAFDISLLQVFMVYANGFTEQLTYNSGTPNAGDWIANLSEITLSGGAFNEDVFGQKTIVITGFASDSIANFSTTNFNVSVQPNKQLKNIYIVADDAKTTYTSGETFTGEGFKIRAFYQDTEEYTDIDVVQGNASISTINPSLGATLYKTGQQEVLFFYTYLNVTMNATYTITVTPSYQTSKTNKLSLKVVKQNELTHDGDAITDKDEDGYVWALYNVNDTDFDDDDTSPTYGRRKLVNPSAKCYGYVTQGKQTSDTAITTEYSKVILFEDYKPPIEGSPNIIATFPHYVEGYADRINHCRFGILYGNNNARNRLFVSGNEDDGMGNLDWHSTEINVSQLENYEGLSDGDFTYFSDLDYCPYGQLSNKVVGYDVIGNGKLMVLKTDSQQEPTIYYRSAAMINATAYDGSVVQDAYGNILQELAFTTDVGNIGDGGISNKSVINFNGDTLFLTKTGLKGLDISTVVSDNQRYANPRSSFIDKKIKQLDLSKCSLFTYREWLLLTTEDKVYIANYNYKYNKEYEWYILDNVDANYFITINSQLYFTSKDGRLFKFDMNEYSNPAYKYVDTSRIFVKRGGLILTSTTESPMTIDEVNEKIVFNNKYKGLIKDGYKINILNNYTSEEDYKKKVYGYLGIFATQSYIDNTIGVSARDVQGIINNDKSVKVQCVGNPIYYNGVYMPLTDYVGLKFYNGRKVFIDNITFATSGNDNLYIGKEYTIKTIDNDDYVIFKLYDKDGFELNTNLFSKFRLSFVVEEAIIANTIDTVTNSYTGTLSCKLLADHNQYVDIIVYDYQATAGFSGVISSTNNIKAYYITKPFNMDDTIHLKNIWGWTVINDTELSSYQDLGYLVDNSSNRYEEIIKSQSGSTNMDFGYVSFERFTFNTNIMPTVYTSHKVLESVNYISFMFKNEDSTNCVLTNLSIEYTIGIANR